MLRRSKDLKEFSSRLAHILLVPKDIASNELAGKHAKHATGGTDPQDESVPFRAAKTSILKDQPYVTNWQSITWGRRSITMWSRTEMMLKQKPDNKQFSWHKCARDTTRDCHTMTTSLTLPNLTHADAAKWRRQATQSTGLLSAHYPQLADSEYLRVMTLTWWNSLYHQPRASSLPSGHWSNEHQCKDDKDRLSSTTIRRRQLH